MHDEQHPCRTEGLDYPQQVEGLETHPHLVRRDTA
jgi:hypothetical protein